MYPDAERVRADKPNWVWEAVSLDSIAGRHFPMASKYTGFVVKKGSDGELVSRADVEQTIHVDEIVFDSVISPKAFWPEFQPGVFVMDSVSKRGAYHVPGGETQSSSEAGQPIRVVGHGSGLWLSGVGASLSIAILAAAYWRWRRDK